jgi:hypothetical protein
VQPRTRRHRESTGRNRAIARALLQKATEFGVSPPPFEWIAVIAFYSAVHYLNGYLWEKQQYEPRDHDARMRAATRIRDLQPALGSYARLADLAFHARYTPGFRVTAADAESVVQTDLERLRTVVLAQLDPI